MENTKNAADNSVIVNVMKKGDTVLPKYETANSAGMDVRVNLQAHSIDALNSRPGDRFVVNTKDTPDFVGESSVIITKASNVVLKVGGRYLFPTGLYIAIPHGYEAQVRPRSGLAIKLGISIVNTPGTIDSDYRGEIGIALINLGNKPVIIEDGDRIGQLILSKVEAISWNIVDTLDKTERGTGGFNSTGTK